VFGLEPEPGRGVRVLPVALEPLDVLYVHRLVPARIEPPPPLVVLLLHITYIAHIHHQHTGRRAMSCAIVPAI
jgi:hypothetical protein